MLGKLDSHVQNNETGPLMYTIHKINMKCIEDLDIRPKAIKLLDENIGGKLFDTGLGKDILCLISSAILTLNLTDSSTETILAFSLLLPFP